MEILDRQPESCCRGSVSLLRAMYEEPSETTAEWEKDAREFIEKASSESVEDKASTDPTAAILWLLVVDTEYALQFANNPEQPPSTDRRVLVSATIHQAFLGTEIADLALERGVSALLEPTSPAYNPEQALSHVREGLQQSTTERARRSLVGELLCSNPKDLPFDKATANLIAPLVLSSSAAEFGPMNAYMRRNLAWHAAALEEPSLVASLLQGETDPDSLTLLAFAGAADAEDPLMQSYKVLYRCAVSRDQPVLATARYTPSEGWRHWDWGGFDGAEKSCIENGFSEIHPDAIIDLSLEIESVTGVGAPRVKVDVGD